MQDSDFFLKVMRRLGIWTFVCTVSAVPSFLWASGEYDRTAMVFGVGLFIAIYTILSCTPPFERFYAWLHVRKTLQIGYWVRIGLSILFPLGAGVDLIPGMMSVEFVRSIGLVPQSFAGTLLTTVVQGTLLNIILFLFMLVVYAVLRMAAPAGPAQPRGFEVLIPEAHLADPAGNTPSGPSGRV